MACCGALSTNAFMARKVSSWAKWLSVPKLICRRDASMSYGDRQRGGLKECGGTRQAAWDSGSHPGTQGQSKSGNPRRVSERLLRCAVFLSALRHHMNHATGRRGRDRPFLEPPWGCHCITSGAVVCVSEAVETSTNGNML
jgi:hypothetical protein